MIEYRQAGEYRADKDTLHGLVTPFGVETVIGNLERGGFHEKINSGAFTKTLQERDVVLIHDHNTAWPLARTSVAAGKTGGLSLKPDPSAGLRARAKPVQTSVGKDVLLLADAGVIRGMSFGFEVIKDRWTDDEGRASDSMRGTHREILEVRLHEVTTTAFPAYVTTELSARGRGDTDKLIEQRAAAASYSDLHACGECGAQDEYGKYCSMCGEAMLEPADPTPPFCSACGSALGDDRASHVCGERRDDQAVASADAALDEAIKYLDAVRDQLPDEAKQALDLLHAASKNIDGHMAEEGIEDPDKDGAGEATPDDEGRDADLDLSFRIALGGIL